ncbi:putative nucleotidyltransferase, ribonuclease H [Tanacetum coccineum]
MWRCASGPWLVAAATLIMVQRLMFLNHHLDDASKIKMATQYLKDTAALWWRRRYGDIERGMTTIDTWAEFVADFKKQFYQENAKNEAKSRIRKLKQSGTIREYVKEFTTLVLEIPELSDQDSLFYFLDGLQGWAKTELERCGVQDLSTTIAHAKALIDFSTRRDPSKLKDKKVNQEKGGGEKNAQPKVDAARKPPTRKDKNLKTSYKSGGFFICDRPHRARDFLKKASLNGMSAHEDEEASEGREVEPLSAVNSPAKAIYGVAKDVRAKIGEWEGMIDLSVVPMDDFKVVLGLEFLDKELPKKLPPRREVDHIIELETGSKPPAKAPYRMPPPELEELRNQLKDLMDAGYIRPLKGPYDLFDQLGKARYFTKLDLRSGYYQVRIAEGDKAKTTCVTRYGSYEFLVMPFGLTNAPVTFCTLMNKLFHPFLDKFVVVYLDDIVVYSHTLEEHVLHLKQVFQVLRDNKLYVKLEKCSFAQDEVKFLGHKIKDGGLMMDGAKIKAIQDWEPPTKVMELRSFLGLVNYYRRFIMGYSAISSSLTDLLKKNKAWIWDEECQAAFECLKKAVMEEPVLRLPDVTMPFELHTDALEFAIGGVLMQDGHRSHSRVGS